MAQYDVTSTTGKGERSNVSRDPNRLQRRLNNRQIQFIAMGGSIGTALFVSIGSGLAKGGPLSLFLAYTFYSFMLSLVNNCMAEMTILHPHRGGFISMAGKWVDDSFGFMAGWNFFFYEALLVPFEITALNMVLQFWRDDIPTAAVCIGCIVLYALLNVLAVEMYGEAEFFLSGGKMLLIVMLFMFTFVTMIGGNPQHDAYGFRHWKDPGPLAEYHTTDSLGRFEGFLACIWSASFCVVGPEYLAMIAAEAKRPRVYIKRAFKTIYIRFGLFFVLGSLCVGILIPYNDPILVAMLNGSEFEESNFARAASPWVIAINNLGVEILPHIVNALLVTSIFSCGNTYTYCATRSLHALAQDGRAPKIFTKTTKSGVPYWSLAAVMVFPCLSFLQLSKGSAQVLTWLVNLITAGGVIDHIVICVTYLYFYRACKAQRVDRSLFPYKGWGQPYCGWIGLVWMVLIVMFYGYEAFAPWDGPMFISCYAMVIVAPLLFLGWKVCKGTKFVKPIEADLVWERLAVDEYEREIVDEDVGFWREIGTVVLRRKRKVEEERGEEMQNCERTEVATQESSV